MIYYKLNLTHELISNSSQCFICTDKYMKLESVIILSWIHSNYPKEISPKGNQSWIFIGRKFQYFGHLMQRIDSLEKTLMMGKIEDRRRRGRQRMRWLDGITGSMDMSLSKWTGDVQGSLACYSPWGCKESDMTKQLNWTDSNYLMKLTRCSLKVDYHTVFTSISSQHSTKLVQN